MFVSFLSCLPIFFFVLLSFTIDIAEQTILLDNYDLSISIICLFQLPTLKILTNVFHELAKQKEWNKVREMLRRGKVGL